MSDQDANACLAVVKQFDEMVTKNREGYDKKVAAWEAGRNAHANEYKLGKTAPSRGYGNPQGGGARPSLVCEGEGNYFTFLGSRQGSWLDRIYGRCKNGAYVNYGGMGGGLAFEKHCPQGFTGVGVDPGGLVHRVAAKCGNQWSHAKHLNTGHYDKWNCPPGTVLKRIDVRTGSRWDYLKFTCQPPNYKPGNWPTLTSYYVGKTGKTKPTFKPIPVGHLPCQYCINKAANLAVEDSQKTEVIQTCANNIKQEQVNRAEEEARKKAEEDKRKAEEEAAKEAKEEKEIAKKQDQLASSSSNTLYAAGGGMLSLCSIIVILIGVIIFVTRKKK